MKKYFELAYAQFLYWLSVRCAVVRPATNIHVRGHDGRIVYGGSPFVGSRHFLVLSEAQTRQHEKSAAYLAKANKIYNKYRTENAGLFGYERAHNLLCNSMYQPDGWWMRNLIQR